MAPMEGFIVPPYVLETDTASAVIGFELREDLPAMVVVFDGEHRMQFSSDTARHVHFIRVEGLDPGRSYRYQVTAGQGKIHTPEGDPEYRINTAGQPGDSFHFAVFGDPRPGETGSHRQHHEVVSAVADLEPAFFLLLGDMVDHGEQLPQWQEFFAIEHDLMKKAAVFPVIGDNDHAGGRGHFRRYFPGFERGYYRFEWAGIQFFALNAWGSRGGQDKADLMPDSEQFQWFERELSLPQVRSAPFRILFLHDPVRISRGRASDTLKRSLAPMIEQGNIDLVFASWHLYERSHYNGVTYVISGGAGAELIWMPKDPAYASQAEARAYHYCRVDVTPQSMTLKAIDVQGTVLDEFTLTPKAGGQAMGERPAAIAERIKKEIFIPAGPDARVLPLQLFSHDCPYCRRLINRVLPAVSEKYNVAVKLSYFDLSMPSAYPLFLTAGEHFGQQGADLPAIFIGREVLGGEKEIRTGLSMQVEQFLKDPEGYRQRSINPFDQEQDIKNSGTKAFESLTLSLVAGAGLIDGLNPCAFGTIILLVSFLTLFGTGQRVVIWAGTTFIFGVFLTYMTIGMVFYHSLRSVLMNPVLGTGVNMIMLLLLVALCLISVMDVFRLIKTDKPQILKFPESGRRLVEKMIREFARTPALKLGMPFALGVVIAGMEFTCTGQVYIPIVTMLSEPEYRVGALGYLFVYNLVFILPLIVVFVLVVSGTKMVRPDGNNRLELAAKLGHAVLFFTMALVVSYNLGWI